ncbi:MAG: hypothetical protein BA871_12630 [Desulfuromonadales bacterium C00003096]|nr:MAG: hypothetical protein BA871_12630 [Desulfuromonadales bacterium C00003096]
MCTIGNVFLQESNGIITFKQCDLDSKVEFNAPIISAGKDDIKYLPFTRAGSKGPWSGINSYGVSFVAADSYLLKNDILQAVNEDIFAAYTKIVSDYKTAEDAANYMCEFYTGFNNPDILLINDHQSAFFIEANEGTVECIKLTENFFASTNHFRILPNAIQYRNNHSTYLRLERAEAILERNTNALGVFKVLRDQYFGESVLSICRVNTITPPQEDPYYTQATSIFFTDGFIVNCVYQLNGNPRTNKYILISDVFGDNTRQENLSIGELAKKLTDHS